MGKCFFLTNSLKGVKTVVNITFCVACEKKILETHVYFFQFLTTVFGETAKCDLKLTNTVTCTEFGPIVSWAVFCRKEIVMLT